MTKSMDPSKRLQGIPVEVPILGQAPQQPALQIGDKFQLLAGAAQACTPGTEQRDKLEVALADYVLSVVLDS